MTKPTALHLVRLVAAAVLAPAVVLNERKVAYPRRLAFQLSVELAAAVLALAVVLNERIVAYPRRLGFQPSGALMLPPLALALARSVLLLALALAHSVLVLALALVRLSVGPAAAQPSGTVAAPQHEVESSSLDPRLAVQ